MRGPLAGHWARIGSLKAALDEYAATNSSKTSKVEELTAAVATEMHELKVPKAFGELMATVMHELKEELLSIRMYGPQAQKVFGELMAARLLKIKAPKAVEELMATTQHKRKAQQ